MLIAGVLVVAVTELLGLVGLIAPVPVGLVWGSVSVGCLARWHGRRPSPGSQSGQLVSSFLRAPVTWGVVSLFLGLTFVTGFVGAPNVWDGLTYHLPRVERWVEQGHLGFWPTSVDRQLWMAPWSGYAILQFRLLTGGDRLAFLPSWLAYLGCIFLTARVVRQLGGDDRQAALGALIFAAIPVAVLHASSVQTDLAAAFWVLCVAALALEAWQRKEAAGDWRHVMWIGVAVGLAVATKGTVLLALVPWLLLYAAALVRWLGWRALIRPLLMGACAVLLLNGAHFARNTALFGDPLGDATTRGFLRLTPWSPADGGANLLANVSLHVGAPWQAWNDWWMHAIQSVQRALPGVEPSTLFPYFGGFRVHPYSTHESMAGNPIHLLLALGLVVSVWTARRCLRGAPVLPWLAAGFAAVVLHGLLVRWQPFGARLQLASMVWLGVAAALVLRGRFQMGIAAAAAVVALHPLTSNALRPLAGDRSILKVPRGSQYFAERPDWHPMLTRATSELSTRGCRHVGLVAGYDTPEYLLRVSQTGGDVRVQFSHLAPASASAVLVPSGTYGELCGILIYNASAGAGQAAEHRGMELRWTEGPLMVFMRPGS